jgi:hypothetical protein
MFIINHFVVNPLCSAAVLHGAASAAVNAQRHDKI